MVYKRSGTNPHQTLDERFDTAALSEPVPRTLGRFRRELRSSFPGVTRPRTIMLWSAGVLAILALGLIALGALLVAVRQPGLGSIAGMIVVLLVTIGALCWGAAKATGSTRTFRLSRFAERNGMGYLPSQKNPDLPGALFGRGTMRKAHDIFRYGDAPDLEIGGFTYHVRSWMDTRTTMYRRGYIGIRLPKSLPHIVLVRRRSLVIKDLWETFDRDQRLSLEGDWDRHFSLYCPRGYERDALYLFAPDVMAQFIDSASDFDAEIVDDWLFLYAARPFATTRPQTWVDVHQAIAPLSRRIHGWGRWTDERSTRSDPEVPAPGSSPSPALSAEVGPAEDDVAPQGRRLRTGLTWLGVLAVVGTILYVIVSLIT